MPTTRSTATEAPLTAFHPLVAEWFAQRFGTPTDVQARSWPRIAAGEHLVVTAPTGSGKTLTAFLWALNAFASGRSRPGATRVLYVSPLKALNNDIRRNLREPLTELRALFHARGEAFPELRANVRSGDTSPGERQRLLRRPPEILITTPESLSLMLTTVRGRHALGTVETAVLDEIHAVVENRRGVSLTTSLERLVEIAGEFQRIALSATVRPLETVARYIGGHRRVDGRRSAKRSPAATTEPRPVATVESQATKQIHLTVRFPEAARAAAENGQKIWDPLADTFKTLIDANRSTLFFTNSRRMAEKITLKLNEGAASPLAYAHHGSLSREIRTEVERRLKDGELRAIVATNSLEMGIDIGALDEVALIQSPPSIAAALQRIGRAGHNVGEASRGTLFPTHGRDFLDAAALAGAVAERDIEPLRPMSNPLDVLAQVIVSAAASETWHVDDLYALLRRATPFETLDRTQFDLVVEMLAGRYAGTRVRDLQPRIAFDRLNNAIRARKGAVFALYNAGGTIPERGYFKLRHAETGAAIGELDEEFVWEATVGDAFTLGTQSWRIHRITHNDVLVKPAPPDASAPPFWRAEVIDRGFHFAQRAGAFLERAEGWLASNQADALMAHAQAALGFDATAAEELVGFLRRQREATGRELPHRRHVLVEHILSAPGGYSGVDREQQVVLHTAWGGRVNRPIALALAAAWRERFDAAPDVHADNHAIVVQIKDDIDPEAPMTLVTPANFQRLLREALEASGFFGARFRECAGRSLLLTRQRFNQRLPLWLLRMQAKKLMAAVARLEDFPVLLEAWRTCLRDEFDLPAAEQVLAGIESGAIAWSLTTVATPSPFAAGIAFGQLSRHMYADDTPETRERSALSDDLLRQAVYDGNLRPRITPAVAAAFEAKAQRNAPGYAPRDADELAEWVKERVLIPASEFAALLDAADLAQPTAVMRLRRGRREWFVHREDAANARRELLGEKDEKTAVPTADGRDARTLFLEFARFYGPLSLSEWAARFPLPRKALAVLIDAAVAADVFVSGLLLDGAGELQFCDARNLETLIRFQRAANRPRFEPRAVRLLPIYLAAWHRLGTAASASSLLDAAERLRGYRAPLRFWLEDAWGARLDGFSPQLLSDACANAGLAWRGVGKEQATFGFEGEIDDLTPATAPTGKLSGLFADPAARYTFQQLMDASGEDAETFNDQFWRAVWNGEIGADGPQPLQAGAERRFQLGPAGSHPRHARGRARQIALGWPGNWFLTAAAQRPPDALEALEGAKERCRVLLDRYGIVCREVANREGGGFRWAAMFPALRIMELAGEVTAGLFFSALSGPQFALPVALRHLEGLDPRKATFWVSALDPVAPAGLGLEWDGVPQRRQGNYLGFHRGELGMSMEGNGRRLRIFPPADDPALDALLSALPLPRQLGRRIELETIDGAPAKDSPHLPALARHWTLAHDHRGVYLERPIG